MLIALDPGHGGNDPGAVYNNRSEKDDNLRLALAVGDILKNRGIDVFYTRTDDIYETPYKKATDANEAGADYFVSFHRNSGENPNTASGAQTLIYSNGGEKERFAKNVQDKLISAGFNDLGIIERPNLVVLKRTKMPAILLETGFINNDADNEKFDRDFSQIAQAIADGILETIGDYDASEDENHCDCATLYRVQVGAYNNRENAQRLHASLAEDGFDAFIVYLDGLYKVQAGAYRELDNAVKLERKLRKYNYNTFITT